VCVVIIKLIKMLAKAIQRFTARTLLMQQPRFFAT